MKKIFYGWRQLWIRRLPTIVLLLLLSFAMINPAVNSASLVQKQPNLLTSKLLTPPKAGWEPVDSGVAQDLNSVFFICLNRGSVVGDDGVILRTGNGGINWTLQSSGVPDNLYGVSYYGYTITLAVGASGTILLTNDSGQTWMLKQTGMLDSYASGQMITDTIGVAVGVNAIFQAFVTRTNDGWNTWQSTSFYIEHDAIMYEGWLSDVYFMNESVGVATAVVDVPPGGAIVRTADGGTTWQTVYFCTEALTGVDVTWEGNGYAVGAHGTILKSVDAGQTWIPLSSGVNEMLQGVDFPSETVGFAVGGNGVILRTDDAGVTWKRQASGTPENLLGVQSITEQTGIVVGEHGVILRTTTGGYPPDITPPETTCILEGTMQEDEYISNVTVTLSAIDNGSGVASTLLQLDNGTWDTYSKPFIVSNDGQHFLQYYSIDYAGNVEAEKTCAFTIHHPPTLAITISGGVGVHALVKNLGPTNLTNGTWNLNLTGGLILIGRHASGTMSIHIGEEIPVKILVIGVGNIQITFTLAASKAHVEGRALLFFIRLFS